MKKHFGLLLLVAFALNQAAAQSCCNGGGLAACGSTGLLTNLRNNSAGLRLMAVPFETSATNEDDYKDHFYMAELSLRYQIRPRIRVALQQPYRWNVRQQASGDEHLSGIADTRITGSYAVLDNKMLPHNTLIYWELGTGLKLPTGKYDKDILSRELPGNMNLGMGNFGYLLQSNLVFFHKKMGLAQTTSVQINGKSRDDYHFGNQVATSLSLFREIGFGEKTKLTPLAGISSEWFGKNHTALGNEAFGSGGFGWFAMAGMNARFGKLQASLSTSMPFYQYYSKEAIVAKQRFSMERTRCF